MRDKLLNNFQQIVYEKPADIIINQIRELITSGQLKPGDKLPPERKLSERLSVSRSAVRDAIKKLEFYGILKTHPQSGTVVAGMGLTALQGLISDVLKIDGSDFKSLVEARIMLELNAAYLAAERRTDENILKIQDSLDKYHEKFLLGEPTVEEDLMFHLDIAEASQNSVLKSFMMVITPDIITNFVKFDVCGDDVKSERLKEHQSILEFIKNQDKDKAREAMENHLGSIRDFSISDKIDQL